MTQHEHEPLQIKEILLQEKIIEADGSINKLGLLALFSGRTIEDMDPLEVESNTRLTEMVMDQATDIETLERIKKIADIRREFMDTEIIPVYDVPELDSLSNQELADLLRQGNLSHEMIMEIDRIARERSQNGGLSSTDD